MQTDLLIIENRNVIPFKRSDHGMGVSEEGQDQGPQETGFLATLAGMANDQQSHSGSVGESRKIREGTENAEAESAGLKRDTNEELAKAGTTFRPFLTSGGKTGVRSVYEDLVRGESLAGSGLKASQTGLNVTTKDFKAFIRGSIRSPWS